jgi:hypothetical protein
MLFYKDNNMKIMDWYDIRWWEDEAKYNCAGVREREVHFDLGKRNDHLTN